MPYLRPPTNSYHVAHWFVIFVINDAVSSTNGGKPVWQTNTASPTGNSTCIVAVQNDGNVVIYKGTPIWTSNTQKS